MDARREEGTEEDLSDLSPLRDAETGLVRFGARDYDSSVGRWTTRDPIAFAGGQPNLYQYVRADPINLNDPSGRGPIGIGVAAACFTLLGSLVVQPMISLAIQISDLDKRIAPLERKCEVELACSRSEQQELEELRQRRRELLSEHASPQETWIVEILLGLGCLAATAWACSPTP